MVTFRLSDFEKKLLNIKISKNWDEITKETTDKFHFGIEYAVTFDPGFEFPKDMIESQRFFFVDDNGNIIKANDKTLFVNAIDYSDDVRCEIVYKIVYKTNCTIVIFRFMPIHPFSVEYPYTSLYRTVFGRNHLYRGTAEDGLAITELCVNDPDVSSGLSDKWIITNDIYEIKGIHSDIIEIDDDDDESDDDSDNEDDADTDDESDDDSE